MSNEHDVSVDWVVRELRSRDVPFLRLNTDRAPAFAFDVDPVKASWLILGAKGPVSLCDLKAVWYRRPEPPSLEYTTGLQPHERVVAADQWRAVTLGMLGIPGVKWINNPHANAAAESKILQLRAASEVGFRVPDTIITNARDEAMDFIEANGGRAIIKALHAPLIETDDRSVFIYSNLLERDSAWAMQTREIVPFILQRAISPKTDVRVTVIDEVVLAARVKDKIDVIDWRTASPPAQFVAHSLPSEVKNACLRLVSGLGLRFGAVDLVLDGLGNYYFLEINPNGEWGWLQHTCQLPIAQALADALLRDV